MSQKNTTKSVAVLLLASIGFASGSSGQPVAAGMFDLYRRNRSLQRSNYVTEDFLLLAYSQLLRDAIATHEKNDDYPQLRNAIGRLQAAARKTPDNNAVAANRL